MANTKEILQDFIDSTEQIRTLLLKSNPATYHLHGVAGKWNSAEIMEHLYISDRSGLYAMMRKTAVADRDPLEKIEALQERMNLTDLKLVAPEGAMPKGIFKTVDEAIQTWHGTRLKVIELTKNEDMNLMAMGFEHPRLGYMTRWEWVKFLTWHGAHHMRQLMVLLK